MPDESFPIKIGEETYFLRFEDCDVSAGSGGIEQYLSLYVAFHPINRTYDNAALFLWKGLRKKADNGDLVYALQQAPPGKIAAFRMIKEFCRGFPGISGMMVLYGSFEKALIVSGWFAPPDAAPAAAKEPGEPSKN